MILLSNKIFFERNTFLWFVIRCTEIFILTYVASCTPLNIYNFANFTDSNKSFYIGILESVYFEQM